MLFIEDWSLSQVIGLAVATALTWVAWGVCRRASARRWREGGSYLHLSAPPQVAPEAAARLWRHVAAVTLVPWWKWMLFGQPHIVFEYAYTGRELDVRVWVPKVVNAAAIRHAVASAWPGSSVRVTEADVPVPVGGSCQGGTITFATVTPVSTESAEGDALRGILAAAPASTPRESVVVQVLARPARDFHVRRARPRPPGSQSIASLVLDLIQPGPSTPRTPTLSPVARDQQRVLAQRLAAGPMFQVGLRYAVTDASSRDASSRLRLRADAVAGATVALCGGIGVRRRRVRNAAAMINNRAMHGGCLLNVNELSAVAHLPFDPIVPELERAGARLVAAPADAISGGRGTKPLGVDTQTGRKIALSKTDARYHVHVIGPTGVGKSTFLLNMALADIRDHRGVVVVDPRGDLVNDILDRLDPVTIAKRLYLIDPAQPGPRWGLDPLTGTDPDTAADNLVNIYRRLWQRHWGPRADDILRMALLTLQRHQDTSLMHLPSLLAKKEFRAPYVADIDEPSTLGGFWEWFDAMTPGVQAQAIGPVMSRVRAMLTRPFVRDTIGAPGNCVDMRDVLDNGGIVLARIPKGQLGEDAARLLGSIIVAKVWQAATQRASQPEQRRRDATLIVDEAQNFLTFTDSIGDILAEARGFHLSMVLAHQFLAQLPKELLEGISANARSKVYFTTSPEDADALARHTLPNLTGHDLSHLPAYHAACRTIRDGKELAAFTMATLPPPEAIAAAEAVRRTAMPCPQ